MSSRIEQLIDDIEDYIDNCKYLVFSNTKIIVNKDEIEGLIRELRAQTPEEINRYRRIIQNKEDILNNAKAKAEQLIKDTTIQTTQLLNEHQLMQQAHAHANEVMTAAEGKAQEILDRATLEVNGMRMGATKYTDEMLAYVETMIASSIQTASADYEKLIQTASAEYENLIGHMKQYQEVIAANRRELMQPEDLEEGVPEVATGAKKEKLELM